MTTTLLKLSNRHQQIDQERALIDVPEARHLFRQTVLLPKGCKLSGFSIARVFPSRTAGVGVQWDIRLAPPTPGPLLNGSVYATSGAKVSDGNERRLRASPRTPFRLTGISCRLTDSEIVLNTPDQDGALSSIARATRPSEVERRISSGPIAAVFGGSKPIAIDCLNYRPGRRCVLRYRAGNAKDAPFVVGKIFRDSQALRKKDVLLQMHRVLAQQRIERIQVPRVFAAWPDWNMLVFEGLPAADATARRLADEDVVNNGAAQALAVLHGVRPQGLRTFTPKDELVATGRWVKLAQRLGRFDPRARSIWNALKTWASRLPPASRSFIHRDFHDQQLLRTPTGWALVDFDTAAQGDREQDIGNFIGHLAWNAVRRTPADSAWTAGAASFLSQYEARSHQRRRRAEIHGPSLRFYLVSSLLRVGIIHSLRTGTERLALRLHKIAEGLVALPPRRLLTDLRNAALAPSAWSA